MGPDSVIGRAIRLGGALPIELVSEDGGFNARIARAAEFPAANMVTDARSVARMYAATIGEVDGIRLLEPETLAAATTVQTTRFQRIRPASRHGRTRDAVLPRVHRAVAHDADAR